MEIDWIILEWIQETLRSGVLDTLMLMITRLGNGGMIWIIIGVLLIVPRHTRPLGLMLLSGLAIGALVGNLTLKPLIARDRPCWLGESVSLLIPVPHDFSFPSGHTLSSSVAATILFLGNRRIGWLAIALAVAIAFSRLYLYVHFPSDVLAGTLIGITIGMIVYNVGTKFRGHPTIRDF